MKTKTVCSFQIIDHGVMHSQYFQGCGISFTQFQDVATGIGTSAYEALEDALDSLAQNEWDTSIVTNTLSDKSNFPNMGGYNDRWYYVSVRVSENAAE